MDQINRVTAGLVKAAITRSGLSINTVAAETNIAKTTLLRSLAGKRSFPIDELVTIAECLGVDPRGFLPDEQVAS